MAVFDGVTPAFIGAANAAAGGYEIERSLRFNSADSAYLNRTPSVAGNRRTWTWSGWIKRSAIATHTIFAAGGTVNYEQYGLSMNEAWSSSLYDGAGSDDYSGKGDGVLRDLSAWYHIVVAYDTTQTTASDRIKLYLNGELQDNPASTYPAQYFEGEINNTTSHTIGKHPNSSQYYANAYLAEIHFVDGQALAATDFGDYDDNNVWQPKEFDGSYNTDGYTVSGGPYYTSGTTWAHALNGSTTGRVMTYTTTSTTATFSPGISWSSQVRIYGIQYGGGYCKVNGGSNLTGFSTTAGWVDVTTQVGSSGTLTSLTVGDVSSNYFALYAIELDGTILNVPQTGVNGFHLDFSDTSSDAALGTDSSGNSNDWTVNNIRAYPNLPYADYWTGTFLAGEPGANAFDGSSITAARPDSSQTITWTPATSIPFTKLRMRAAKSGAGTNISVNGTDVTESFNPQNTVDITSLVSSPLTSISLTSTASERPKLMFVEVDDVILISGHNTDSFIDSPTNYTAASGNNGGNYATLNRLNTLSTTTFSNGSLDITSSGQANAVSSIVPSSGKWYFEIKLGSIVTNSFIGLYGTTPLNSSYVAYGINGYGFLSSGWGSPSSTVTGTGVAGDIIGLAFDADAKTLEYYKNGSSIGTISGWTYVENWSIGFSANSALSTPWVFNFGQRPFAYTPPTNYLSLCTTNFSNPTIADGGTAMNAALYTGNGASNSITGLGFAPDILWLKSRSNGTFPALANSVVGPYYFLRTNGTNVESGPGYNDDIVSFDSDGFTLGADTYYAFCNTNTYTYVGWAWDSGTTTGSNTDGTITSQVRANQSTGCSIVSYTSTDVAGATVGHGLNAVMDFAILKNRDRAQNWLVYHKSLDITSGEAINLNQTNAAYLSAAQFNSTLATSSVFTLGTGGNASNAAGDDIIAFCFATVEGYSAFGSYTGNGNADGPFVYTGFRPKWILLKESSAAGNNWNIYDTSRDEYNVTDAQLKASSGDAEATNTFADYLSNGFKIRTSTSGLNTNTQTFIYAAFAEHPFKTARAR